MRTSSSKFSSGIKSISNKTVDVTNATQKLRDLSSDLDKITASLSMEFDQFETGND